MYVPLHLATALGVALLLNQARRLKGIYRTAFYLPSMTPAVATAYLWVWMLNPNDGLVNRSLRALNLPAPAWTVDPAWTKPAIVISQVWMMGGAMIIFLAALQGVPTDLYEAATLDGAGRWRRFRNITLPMISGVTFFLATVAPISALGVFTQGYVMFDKDGGPQNSALFIVMYLFKRAFGSGYFQMGYASAHCLDALPDHPGHHRAAVLALQALGLLRAVPMRSGTTLVGKPGIPRPICRNVIAMDTIPAASRSAAQARRAARCGCDRTPTAHAYGCGRRASTSR